MACYTNNEEFFLAGARIIDETGLNKDTVYKTVKWIREIGLIKDTGKRAGGNGQIVIYKFTQQINLSKTAISEMSDNPKLSYLSENSDSNLSENSDSNLSENSETKGKPKHNKITSCWDKPIKSPPIIQEEPTKKVEGEEGFLLIKSILKSCRKFEKMQLLGNKHSIHSINCYHLQLKQEMARGVNVTIAAFLSRLDGGDEWTGKPPFVLEPVKSKLQHQASQMYINLLSELKTEEEKQEEQSIVDNTFGDIGEKFKEQMASW